MALNPDDLLIFKAREEEKEAEAKKKEKRAAPVAKAPPSRQPERTAPSETGPAGYNEEAEELSEGTEIQKEGAMRRSRRMDPRKLAEHMNCELHPWRRAYAICDYCKRAFCYEDIIESGGKYYCLDDLDKVPETVLHAQLVKYNSLSLVSAVLYMVVFLLFIYYTYQPVTTIFSELASLGLWLFVNNIALANVFLLMEILLAAVALIGSVMILLNSRSSFRVSAIVSIFGVAIFSYQYINLNQVYLAALGGLLFIAFVTLAYSRVSYETLGEDKIVFEDEAKMSARGSF